MIGLASGAGLYGAVGLLLAGGLTLLRQITRGAR